MGEPKKKKSEYWDEFDGSRALFEVCWKRCRQEGFLDDPQEDVENWLEAFAAEAVNDSDSRFYIYG